MKKVSLIHLEMVKEKEAFHERPITDKAELYELAKKLYQNNDREKVYVCGVDASHTVVFVEVVAQGQLDQCSYNMRDMFKSLILSNCAAFFVWHNHTSYGKLASSEADRIATRNMKKAGELLRIEFLDHIVVNENGFVSIMDEIRDMEG